VEWSSGTDERIQVCVSGLRPAHHRRLKHKWWANPVPDLLSEDHRPTSPGSGRFQVHPIGFTGWKTAAAPDLDWFWLGAAEKIRFTTIDPGRHRSIVDAGSGRRGSFHFPRQDLQTCRAERNRRRAILQPNRQNRSENSLSDSDELHLDFGPYECVCSRNSCLGEHPWNGILL